MGPCPPLTEKRDDFITSYILDSNARCEVENAYQCRAARMYMESEMSWSGKTEKYERLFSNFLELVLSQLYGSIGCSKIDSKDAAEYASGLKLTGREELEAAMASEPACLRPYMVNPTPEYELLMKNFLNGVMWELETQVGGRLW